MKLICLGSSSHGNCYILQSDNGKYLIIDAGIDFKKVMQAIDFNVSNIAACLSTHIHKDHSRAVKDFLQYAIPVYVSKEHKQGSGIVNDKLITIEPDKVFKIERFSIIPFEVPHDAYCFGFFINHSESGNILYLTDCFYCPRTFSNLSNILIECNYRMDILEENTHNGRVSAAQRNRTLQSHMSYETCWKTLLANDLSKVNNIVLIHLSNDNSNALDFQQGIHKATGKTTRAADKGMVMDFNKTPF